MVLIAATMAGTHAARGQESPFALATPSPTTTPLTTLSDTMATVQLHHLKLWHAGKMENWALAAYEVDQLRRRLTDAAMSYRGIPVEYATAALDALRMISDAAAARNSSAFLAGFSTLTKSCNSCHAAGDVGFIRLKIPTSTPFPNQDFRAGTP
jgi:hypothetical protein